MTVRPETRLTYAEYVRQEETAETRSEFIHGEVFAMAGGTIEHAGLAASAMREIGAGLAGKPCRAFSSDLRILVKPTGASFYPGVSVVCGKVEVAPGEKTALTNPVLLVEILSEGTEAYDRGAKAMHYRRIPTLKEYVLVNQTTQLIEVQRLNERGIWELHFFAEGERVELTSLGVSFPVDAVYANALEPTR